MEFFDAHADTMSKLLDEGKELFENDLHIDYKRLSAYRGYTQVFAVFVSPGYSFCAKKRAEDIVKKAYNECKKCGITVCESYSDWQNATASHKAFLSLEGGYSIEKIEDIKELYDMGIRMIAPTWDMGTKIASGIMDKEDIGLSEFGKKAILEMNRLGIIIDVSHISEKAFWDVAKISEKPIIASHSNLRSVINHKRNLTDNQFLEICKMGGAVGINFYPPFFGEDILMLKEHIDKMLLLGGEDHICLGTDFDGIDRLPKGMNGVEDMEKIIKSLPYSTKIKEKIASSNLLRVIKHYNC